jgi:hypothetical protein
MGPFLVHTVSAVPALLPAAGRPRQLLCSGELTGWTLATGKPAAATFLHTALRKDDSVVVLCYDCCERNATPFHFLGLECKHCGSFNTTRV